MGELLVILKNNILAVLIIVFGSFTNVITRYHAARKQEDSWDLLDWTVALITAMFSGVLSGILASYFTSTEQLIYAAAAIGGFIGHRGLNILTDLALETAVDNIKKKQRANPISGRTVKYVDDKESAKVKGGSND